MQTQVKICGLTREDDVQAAIRYGASFLGFIVEAKSKRRLDIAQAASLARPAAGLAQRVAVTVNADDSTLSKVMAEMGPDYIQCHGDESPARLADIARRYAVKTIKAVAIAEDADMKAAEQFSGVADIILYDAKPPRKNSARGGHGVSFDWDILTRNPLPKIWALAGGLNPDTITRALSLTRAPIVDVASGVEAYAGVKDLGKIQAFMKAVHHG